MTTMLVKRDVIYGTFYLRNTSLLIGGKEPENGHLAAPDRVYERRERSNALLQDIPVFRGPADGPCWTFRYVWTGYNLNDFNSGFPVAEGP